MKNFLQRCGLGILILACTVGAARAQQRFPPLDFADDLAALGTLAVARGTPIMLVFTRPDCPFCMRAKKDHLEPLRVSENYGAKIIIREIAAGDHLTVLREFEGNLTTHGEFARKHEVRMVPTVMVVDAQGRPLAEPLIGLTSPDFYNLYLEQAIDAGRLRLRTRGQ